MLYIVKNTDLNVCITFDNYHKAYSAFDSMTDKGHNAILYSFCDGVLSEMENITYMRKRIGAMT